MLIKNADIDFPVIVDLIRKTRGGEDVESEILSLRPAHVWMAIDPAQAEAAGKVGTESAIWPNEVVAPAEVDPEIVIFDASENWFEQGGQTKLVIAAQPAITVV